MRGKSKCKILKEIRQRIADENDIPYVTHECRFKGECSGTCPRCESELRYLEQQLALRVSLGKRVTVAALCAGMALSAAGCAPSSVSISNPFTTDLSGAVPYEEPTPEPTEEIYVESGEVAWPEDEPEGEPEIEELTGEEAWPPEEPEDVDYQGLELMGDVAYFPEDANG